MSESVAPYFSIGGPLPSGGTTMVQASAGTGKTYALAALTVRYVAERDIPISRILLVTFTRAATAELRDRIRKRLVETADHLAGLVAAPDLSGPSGTPVADTAPVADGAPASDGTSVSGGAAVSNSTDDELLEVLGRGSQAELEVRLRRLRRAVREFDTAIINTIHGFCSQVRSSLGVLSADNVDAVPAESELELISQVCADLLFKELDGAVEDPVGGRSLSAFEDIVRKARTLSDSTIEAESLQDCDLAMVRLATSAVAEIDDRLARAGGLSFDSLLSSVRDALRSDPGLAGRLRGLYDVALIDEFQDTDSVQWEIFRTVFGEGAFGEGAFGHGTSSTLILVGDPKQAIYSFRGGDVYTYLEARKQAEVLALGTNQRSDESTVEAMNSLCAGHVFGEPEIDYTVVSHAPRHDGRRLTLPGQQTAAGMHIRCLVEPAAAGVDKLDSPSARRRIAKDLADIAAELITEGSVEEPGEDPVRVTPGMIAVLVGATSEAPDIAAALRDRNIPAVLRLKDNVVDSEAHGQWRTLLWALERPADTRRASAAALSWFFGWPAEDLARAIEAGSTADAATQGLADRDLVDLQLQLVQWGELLAGKGMAALLGEARRTNSLDERLLRGENGERNLTDLEHLAELVHEQVGTRSGGVHASAALAILDGLDDTPSDEVAAEAVQRRIESDADAVQIMTIHGAKGLEFPVVLLPSLWSGGKRVQAEVPYSYYDRSRRQRVLDVSSGRPKSDDAPKRTPAEMAPDASAEARRQACGDQHRMTYVALTRAVHQSVVWWTPVGGGRDLAGLSRLLFGAPDDTAADSKVEIPAPDATVQFLKDRFAAGDAAGDAPGHIRVSEISSPASPSEPLPAPVGRGDTTADGDDLEIATLGRPLSRDGSGWSFSSLTRLIRTEPSPMPGSDPTVEHGDDRGAGDEPSDPEPAALLGSDADPRQPTNGSTGTVTPTADRGLLFEGLGAGRDFGNLVHDLFEHLDFTAADSEAAIAELLDIRGGSGLTDDQRAGLPGALAAVLRTPLGERFGDLRLADLQPGDHLDELDFHLPLAPDRPVTAASIGTVVRNHLAEDDPLAPWAERLAAGLGEVDLQGYLNGSIDLTLRYRLDDHQRYSVVDYKTNDLSPRGMPATVAHYTPDRMTRAMTQSHYALQAIIYSVALHRYLRWRLVDYDAGTHLGPVGYLFVRAMVGEDTPVVASGPHAGTRHGVFTWQLAPELIEAVSALFAGDDTGAVSSAGPQPEAGAGR